MRFTLQALIPTLVRQRDTYRDLIVHADNPQSLLASARQLGLLPEAVPATSDEPQPEVRDPVDTNAGISLTSMLVHCPKRAP